MGRKKIQIQRITDERNKQVSTCLLFFSVFTDEDFNPVFWLLIRTVNYTF